MLMLGVEFLLDCQRLRCMAAWRTRIGTAC
jgi:hypothetical protein